MTRDYNGQGDSIPIELVQWDSSWPRLLNHEEKQSLKVYLFERFKIPEEVINRFLWLVQNNHVYALSKGPQIWRASRLKIQRAGIRVFGISYRYGIEFTPNIKFVQVFHPYVRSSRVGLTMEQINILRSGRLQIQIGISPGIVLIDLLNKGPCGLGLYKEGYIEKRGLLI